MRGAQASVYVRVTAPLHNGFGLAFKSWWSHCLAFVRAPGLLVLLRV